MSYKKCCGREIISVKEISDMTDNQSRFIYNIFGKVLKWIHQQWEYFTQIYVVLTKTVHMYRLDIRMNYCWK